MDAKGPGAAQRVVLRWLLTTGVLFAHLLDGVEHRQAVFEWFSHGLCNGGTTAQGSPIFSTRPVYGSSHNGPPTCNPRIAVGLHKGARQVLKHRKWIGFAAPRRSVG